jgi:flagellar biosynthesis chaperone FliJ
VVENLKQSKIRMLEGQLQDLAGKTQQIMAYAKQLESVNGYQGSYLKNLQSEFGNKINSQNKIIGGLAKDLEKYRGASEGEAKSNNSRGVEGTKIAEPQPTSV